MSSTSCLKVYGPFSELWPWPRKSKESTRYMSLRGEYALKSDLWSPRSLCIRLLYIDFRVFKKYTNQILSLHVALWIVWRILGLRVGRPNERHLFRQSLPFYWIFSVWDNSFQGLTNLSQKYQYHYPGTCYGGQHQGWRFAGRHARASGAGPWRGQEDESPTKNSFIWTDCGRDKDFFKHAIGASMISWCWSDVTMALGIHKTTMLVDPNFLPHSCRSPPWHLVRPRTSQCRRLIIHQTIRLLLTRHLSMWRMATIPTVMQHRIL